MSPQLYFFLCKATNINSNTESENDAVSHCAWLKNHRDPWDEVLRLWRLTVSHRKSFLLAAESTHDIMVVWPAYKHPLGHTLVSSIALYQSINI